MKRLRDIQQLLDDLKTAISDDPNPCDEWDVVAEEIVQKLKTILKECERSSRLKSALLTPPQSSSSSSVHSDSSVFSDQVYTQAAEAYDRQIFSRCVQIIEKANRQSPVDMSLISLAHHSYAAMVDEADSSEEALKFAKWWAEFLDSVEAGRAHSEKIELLDYEAVALEKVLRLNEPPTYADVVSLIEVVVRNFKMVSLLHRPYHVIPIRRLHKLSAVLQNLKDEYQELEEFMEALSVMDHGLRAAMRDRDKVAPSKRHDDQRILASFCWKYWNESELRFDFQVEEILQELTSMEIIGDRFFSLTSPSPPLLRQAPNLTGFLSNSQRPSSAIDDDNIVMRL